MRIAAGLIILLGVGNAGRRGTRFETGTHLDAVVIKVEAK